MPQGSEARVVLPERSVPAAAVERPAIVMSMAPVVMGLTGWAKMKPVVKLLLPFACVKSRKPALVEPVPSQPLAPPPSVQGLMPPNLKPPTLPSVPAV
jgi:hypothetical protein